MSSGACGLTCASRAAGGKAGAVAGGDVEASWISAQIAQPGSVALSGRSTGAAGDAVRAPSSGVVAAALAIVSVRPSRWTWPNDTMAWTASANSARREPSRICDRTQRICLRVSALRPPSRDHDDQRGRVSRLRWRRSPTRAVALLGPLAQCYNIIISVPMIASKSRILMVNIDGAAPGTRRDLHGKPLHRVGRVLRVCAGALLCLAIAASFAPAQAAPVRIVAAESVYGEVARQVGGADVTVASIIAAPGQDPHQFEATTSAARALAAADLVIHNGANYDPWIETLLANGHGPARRVVVVAALVNAKPGDNPHLWYDPATMPAV